MWSNVSTFIQKHDLLPEKSVVVVGVSGGADSISLLHYLYNLRIEKDLKLVVAHVDHMFRGKQSEEDLLFVQTECEKRNIPFEAKQIDVPAYQHEHKLSAQVAARECRYQFYQEVMTKYGANVLALGHHGDDQIETMLMRIGRGSSIAGYAGILAKRPFGKGWIVRPLLSVTKDEVHSYIEENMLSYRHDPSNDKDTYRRNRLRHQVLPILKEEFPTLHEKFQSFSEQIQEDNFYLEELTKKEWNKVIKTKTDTRVVLCRKPLLLMAKPLQRRGFQLILNYLYNNEIPPSLSSIHIDNLLSLLESEHPSGMLHFPNGLHVTRSYNDCTLTFENERTIPFRAMIEVPGKITLPTNDVIICEVWTHYKHNVSVEQNQAIINLSNVTLPLNVRTRRDGDRIKLKGTQGSKKLKSVFIEEKVPINKRNVWPLIVDAQDNILWVPLLKRSSFEVTEETAGPVLVVTFKKS
ncbi:tRNA lysidine(34) synthetase TilS [Sutcliffiella halmapala]|uniref:tRNA lysidine(34) synthetase TilS n=1 Tax=Sutcliffiella halmapala TaxID=79882 RepID=UPI0009956B2D|nr:tRNA lysidine(34) synthetase TilS [Sutcliffiella halmapala]